MTVHGLKGLGYSQNGHLHVVPDSESWWDAHLVERQSALCGAGFETATQFLEVNGLRLTDEYERGLLCGTCLERLQEAEVTIPGFLKNGELVDPHPKDRKDR